MIFVIFLHLHLIVQVDVQVVQAQTQSFQVVQGHDPGQSFDVHAVNHAIILPARSIANFILYVEKRCNVDSRWGLHTVLFVQLLHGDNKEHGQKIAQVLLALCDESTEYGGIEAAQNSYVLGLRQLEDSLGILEGVRVWTEDDLGVLAEHMLGKRTCCSKNEISKFFCGQKWKWTA